MEMCDLPGPDTLIIFDPEDSYVGTCVDLPLYFDGQRSAEMLEENRNSDRTSPSDLNGRSSSKDHLNSRPLQQGRN